MNVESHFLKLKHSYLTLCTNNLKVVLKDLNVILWAEPEQSANSYSAGGCSTFFAVLLEATGNTLAMHRDGLSPQLLVDVELLLQSADDYRQVFLSHLRDIRCETLILMGRRFRAL